MKIKKLKDTEKPDFCRENDWSLGTIKKQLKIIDEKNRLRLMAWILREGTMLEIWNLLLPQDVFNVLDIITPLLGRRRAYWRYTFDTWQKLGKVKSTYIFKM